ncbi:methylaspartate mutase subunit S [Hydrogenimonas urashimensis]|uniref:methylaspartate mutase subunit S n=1 Tax=Hydrogenimonas urashimensis TaxID=2740515 RepID=UPI0019163C2F|nr:methylaspartate mutase subunit S [Hydrogenimonas urashimensis]
MKVVTGVVGNDIHVVANRLIEISLKERGFTVFNLGVNTYLEEFLDAVIETDADVLLISSLNGEAEGWCRDLQILKESYRFRKRVVFMIGGNLGVGEMDPDALVPKFKSYGFDLVFHQVDLNEGLDRLEVFLKESA